MPLPHLENERDTAPAQRWRRLAPALVVSGVLHGVLLGLSGLSEPDAPPTSSLEVKIEYLPRPVAESVVETAPPVTPSVPEVEPAELDPAIPDTVDPAAPDDPETTTPALATEPAPEPTESTPTDPPSPLDDPALVTRLLAAPLAPEPPPGPFHVPAVPESDPDAFRIPERGNLITLLSPPLPDLPFADPGLDVFMYSSGWQGELHRGFDNITPEFGWRTRTGLVVRCRWVLVVVGCGWGRSRYSPGTDRSRERP